MTLLSSTDFSKLGGQIDTLKPSTLILKSYTETLLNGWGKTRTDWRPGGHSFDSCGSRTITTWLWRDVQVYITLAEHFQCRFHYSWGHCTLIPWPVWQRYRGKTKCSSSVIASDWCKPLVHQTSSGTFCNLFQVRGCAKETSSGGHHRESRTLWMGLTNSSKLSGDLRICGSTLSPLTSLQTWNSTLYQFLRNCWASCLEERGLLIDLSQKYHQLELTPESRKYTTVNIHLGLYQYKRPTDGVSSAVSVFRRTIENVLKDQGEQMKFTWKTYSDYSSVDLNWIQTSFTSCLMK